MRMITDISQAHASVPLVQQDVLGVRTVADLAAYALVPKPLTDLADPPAGCVYGMRRLLHHVVVKVS